MFNLYREDPAAADSPGRSGIVLPAGDVNPEFWARALLGQFWYSVFGLTIALFCELGGYGLIWQGYLHPLSWHASFFGIEVDNAATGVVLMIVGALWARFTKYEVTLAGDETPPSPPPAPPPPRLSLWQIIVWLIRKIFGRRRAPGNHLSWGSRGVVVPPGSANDEFWSLAEKYQSYYSFSGMALGFLCEILGVLAVWVTHMAPHEWSVRLFDVQITNAPPGVVFFVIGVAIQEFTKFAVQVRDGGGQEGGKHGPQPRSSDTQANCRD